MNVCIRRVSLILICLIGLSPAVRPLTPSPRRQRAPGQQPRRLLKVADKDGRYGFIDTKGRLVIGFDRLPKTAITVEEFSEGRAAILFKRTGVWSFSVGYIDETGQVVIEPRFTLGGPFINGVASVQTDDGSPATINRRGEFVNPGPPPASAFHDGLLATPEGFVDRSGKLVIKGYARVENFSEGLAAVANGGWRGAKYGFINAKGELVIPYRFEPVREHHGFVIGLGRFSEGLASVKVGERNGYIDKKGVFSIPPQFIMAADFSEGRAFVSTEERSGYIDKAGRWIITVHGRTSSERFKEGLAPVAFKTRYGTKVGYVNRSGRVVIAPRFDSASEFKGGIAEVYEVRDPKSNPGSRAGYIDRRGRYIWEPRSGPKVRMDVNRYSR